VHAWQQTSRPGNSADGYRNDDDNSPRVVLVDAGLSAQERRISAMRAGTPDATVREGSRNAKRLLDVGLAGPVYAPRRWGQDRPDAPNKT
jgi:hypothetical protein